MEGYLGLFFETGNPAFYMMAKQQEAEKEKGDAAPRA